jgi:hypothetical protein
MAIEHGDVWSVVGGVLGVGGVAALLEGCLEWGGVAAHLAESWDLEERVWVKSSQVKSSCSPRQVLGP